MVVVLSSEESVAFERLYPRFFALKTGLRMAGPDPSSPAAPQDDKPAVVLSNAKDLGLPVILNGVKNLVLLLKGFYPRFFALKSRAQNDTTRSFGDEAASG
ncbi:hypothetical protein [Aminivibrio sp.]|uniref:hypothetical protein n=1 Tax=Aminivibrio sp. TaxID=1872489 RepID=UPI00345EF1F5